MRKTNRGSGFFICLLFNMLLNLEWSLPGFALLILHFLINIPLWWSLVAFAIWIAVLVMWMRFIGWAGRAGNIPDPPKPNKNPYSKGERK